MIRFEAMTGGRGCIATQIGRTFRALKDKTVVSLIPLRDLHALSQPEPQAKHEADGEDSQRSHLQQPQRIVVAWSPHLHGAATVWSSPGGGGIGCRVLLVAHSGKSIRHSNASCTWPLQSEVHQNSNCTAARPLPALLTLNSHLCIRLNRDPSRPAPVETSTMRGICSTHSLLARSSTPSKASTPPRDLQQGFCLIMHIIKEACKSLAAARREPPSLVLA